MTDDAMKRAWKHLCETEAPTDYQGFEAGWRAAQENEKKYPELQDTLEDRQRAAAPVSDAKVEAAARIKELEAAIETIYEATLDALCLDCIRSVDLAVGDAMNLLKPAPRAVSGEDRENA